MTDTCFTKTYDEAGDDVPDDATPGRRVDRSYRIYPMQEFEPNFHELEYMVPLERGREAVARDARADAAEPARRDLPDGGADDRRRRRLPLPQLRHADDGHLGLRPARHRLLGLPLRRRPAARRVRRARALGQAALPDARAARRALSRERALHRDPPRARPRGRLPQRPPAAALRLSCARVGTIGV